MVRMLAKELDLCRPTWPAPWDTVYFGGGTPGILLNEEVTGLIAHIRNTSGIIPGAEITLEVNPDDVTGQKADAWRDSGINRISLGVQALDDIVLRWMNRSHTASDALSALERLSRSGITNINADLIYGLPEVSVSMVQAWVGALNDAGVSHISAYALTVEPRTVLAKQVREGKACLPEDSSVTGQYINLREILQDAGFVQYELSNFAKPGCESRHNRSYWAGIPYLGLGPSAHSYDGIRRWWNVRSNAKYIEMLQSDRFAVEGEETLTPRNRYNEYIMTGLRRIEGIQIRQADLLSEGAFSGLSETIGTWVNNGWAHIDASSVRLTPQGMMLSDYLISQLFLDEE